MSEGNFEVMPIGTMEEVREMRKFANELIDLEHKYGINTPQAIRNKIDDVRKFYLYHTQKYPVIV
jgi:hypothetical protein